MLFVSHWKRFASFLIDSLFLNFIITKPLSNILQTNLPSSFTDILSLDIKNLILVSTLISLVNLTYWIILEYKIQQTLGGLIFGIEVKTLSSKSLGRIIIRNITKMSTLLLIIDSIGIFTSKKRQRFTEKISNTLTVENG